MRHISTAYTGVETGKKKVVNDTSRTLSKREIAEMFLNDDCVKRTMRFERERIKKKGRNTTSSKTKTKIIDVSVLCLPEIENPEIGTVLILP